MPAHGKKKLGLGQALFLPEGQPTKDSTSQRPSFPGDQYQSHIAGTSQTHHPNMEKANDTAAQNMATAMNEKQAQVRSNAMHHPNEQQRQQGSATRKDPLGQSMFQKANQDIVNRRDSVQLANDQQQQKRDTPEHRDMNMSPSVESEKDSLFGSVKEGDSRAENDKNASDSARFDLAPPMTHPLLSSKHADSLFQTPKPRVSFSDPLTIGSAKDLDVTSSMTHGAASKHQANDLASPSSPAFDPRTSTNKPSLASSRSPSAQPPTKPSDPLQPAVRPVPRKRPVSQLGSTSPVPTNPSTPTSPSSAKRLKSEEMQQRKAHLEAELKAKRERKAAVKKANDEEALNRQEQQRLWAEEDAKRREEDARRKAVEEEAKRREAEEEARRREAEEEEARKAEEAFLAEMEALERENEMEDEDLEGEIEKGERQRMEWEELMRARGYSEDV